MPIEPFVVQPEDRAKPIHPVAGDDITILASAEETQGYEIFLHDTQAGFKVRPHSHDWDESFIVMEGELTFTINGKSVKAKTGALVHLPAGTVHEFEFGPDGAKLMSITGKGSQAASLFTELAKEKSKESPSQDKLMDIVNKYGIQFQ